MKRSRFIKRTTGPCCIIFIMMYANRSIIGKAKHKFEWICEIDLQDLRFPCWPNVQTFGPAYKWTDRGGKVDRRAFTPHPTQVRAAPLIPGSHGRHLQNVPPPFNIKGGRQINRPDRGVPATRVCTTNTHGRYDPVSHQSAGMVSRCTGVRLSGEGGH